MVIVVAFATTAPLVVVRPSAARVRPGGGPAVADAALLIGAALIAMLAVAIALGELPVNVSVRSTDGYNFSAVGDLLRGRAVVTAGGSIVALLASALAVRAASRDRWPAP
jgi:hypothetical protein